MKVLGFLNLLERDEKRLSITNIVLYTCAGCSLFAFLRGTDIGALLPFCLALLNYLGKRIITARQYDPAELADLKAELVKVQTIAQEARDIAADATTRRGR